MISREEALHGMLQRQGLTSPYDSPRQVLSALVAIQTQYAASLPVAVAVRCPSAGPRWHLEALVPLGEVVKTWSLRRTLHAHLRGDHELLLSVLAPDYRRRCELWTKAGRMALPEETQERERRIMEELATGPMTRRELHRRVPELQSIAFAGWGMDVMGLALKGRVSIVGQGAAQKFASLEARARGNMFELARRYLFGFGPATVADLAHWTGLSMAVVRGAFDQPEIERVEVEGKRPPHFLLAGMGEAPPPPRVRLLAKFDPLVLAHRDKTLFLPPEHHARVFRKAGQVEAAILVDGIVAGTWRMQVGARATEIRLEPFCTFGKRTMSLVEREAEKLCRTLAAPPPRLTI